MRCCVTCPIVRHAGDALNTHKWSTHCRGSKRDLVDAIGTNRMALRGVLETEALDITMEMSAALKGEVIANGVVTPRVTA